MVFKCNKCKSKFSSNQMLNYHIDNNVCNDNSKPFKCLFCSKRYKTKFTFLRHLNSKHPKKITINKNIIKPMICQNCNKKFTRKYNLDRHIKKYCKKSNINNTTNNIINNTNNTTNNINSHNTTNITNNITINNFGRESLEGISDNDIFKCVNMCYEGIPALFKLIHIDKPENQNLYLTNIQNPYIYIYSGNKWKLSEIKKILNYIQKDKKDIIEDYIENNNNKFKKYKIININKMINDHKEGLLEKRYNSKLKLLLINNKHKLKKSYKSN